MLRSGVNLKLWQPIGSMIKCKKEKNNRRYQIKPLNLKFFRKNYGFHGENVFSLGEQGSYFRKFGD